MNLEDIHLESMEKKLRLFDFQIDEDLCTKENIDAFLANYLDCIPAIEIQSIPYMAGVSSFDGCFLYGKDRFYYDIVRAVKARLLGAENIDRTKIRELALDRLEDLKHYLYTKMQTLDLFEKVKIAGATLPDRSVASIMLSLVEEVGELSKEVSIVEGMSYKKPDVDGVLGEAVDVLITVLDLIHTLVPSATEEEINSYAEKKIAKWVRKTNEALQK